LATAVIPLLLLSGYMLRNVVTSGWPLFPAPYGGISTQWSLPKETVEYESLVIKNFPRAPGVDFMKEGNKPFHEWLPKWFYRNFDEFNRNTFFLPLLFAFVAALGYWASRKGTLFYTIILIMLFASVIFCLFSSPDIRFARGFVWLWVAFSVLAFYDMGKISVFYNFLLRCRVGILWAALLVEGVLLFYNVLPQRHFDFAFEFSLWSTPKSASRPVKAVVLNNGQTPPLTVWIPEKSDLCGDAPLPCTPYPNDRLRLIVPGDLSSGFYLKPNE
jgi:hypothetical protein